jgi:hypothetical protein
LKREVRKRIEWLRKEKRYGNTIKNPLLDVGKGGKGQSELTSNLKAYTYACCSMSFFTLTMLLLRRK